MHIEHTDSSRPTPFATLLLILGATVTLGAVAPALADSKGGITPVGKPKERQPIVAQADIQPPDPCAAGPEEYDCNQNGINDLCDIADGWADANEDGMLDACQFAVGDLDLDGSVGARDLVMVLNDWGTEGADTNGDAITDGFDLAAVLANWTV